MRRIGEWTTAAFSTQHGFNIWNKPEYRLMFGFFVVILESGVFIRGLEYGD